MGDASRVSAQPLAQTARNEQIVEPTSEANRRRLNTYSQWPSKKSSLQLATAGFIYTGITDKVECQSCGIRLYNWQEDEDPLQTHKKYAPDCEFMLTNFPNVKAPPKPKKILTVKYPHYTDYETRLKSFDSWSLKCVAQKPEMMARSGFFYIGSADRVRCFHCGVTLREWDTNDYPPCAHRQWSENCPYLQQIDVDGMKKDIEGWERYEQLRVKFENSTFIDCSSSVTPTDLDTDDYPPERSLRKAVTTSARTLLPLLHHTHRSGVKLEHRLVLKRGQQAEFEMRGDDNQPGCVVIVERDDRTYVEEE